MADTYLLYIDILGFSEIVAEGRDDVDAVYRALDSIRVHNHHAFRATAFSDTILVWNTVDPRTDDDHEYFVMYACEFAQDLLYRTAGKGIYFRAVLRHGEFACTRLENIECYYGQALIDAYQDEKGINGTGLFIHADCQPHNRFFPVADYSDTLSFVYLSQSLESLHDHTGGVLPADRLLVEAGFYLWIAVELRLLQDTHNQMRHNPDPRVRSKHLATWDYYYRRYPELLSAFERAGFRPDVICPELDWREMTARPYG